MPSVGTLLTDFIRDDLLIVGSIGAGCVMTVFRLGRRERFAARVALSFAVIALWMMVTNAVQRTLPINWGVTGTIRYSGLFSLFAVSVAFWSHADRYQALFPVTVSYSIQNMCERLIEIPRYTLSVFPVLLDRLCLLAMLALCFAIYYRVCIADAHNRAMLDFSNLNSRMMIFMAVGVVLVSVVLDMVLRACTPSDNMMLRNCLNVMSAIFSLVTIILSMSHLRETDSQRRAQIAAQLLRSEQHRYEQEKQVHDAINIKCHDIRQQIHTLRDREGKHINQEFIDKLEKSITIYDAIYHTGNEPLDVILTEKSLLCNGHQIRLACMADAGGLGFMDESDIYSLFGNIIDNAIESVCKLKDEEERVINLEVRKRGNLLNIQEENYFAGDVRFENGLPVSNKQDKIYHGFGTKSIRILVEKYKGNLQMQAKDQVFSINILIPIPVHS